MSDLSILWFRNDACQYCLELDPEVEQFAKHYKAELIPIEAGILDDETGEIQIPAIMFNHPKTRGLLVVGRFCLDAIRWHLAQ